MNKNQLTIVKEYEFNNPSIQKIASLIDNSVKDCHDKYFHTIDHICVYDLNFTNIGKNEFLISQFLIKEWLRMN